MPRLTGGALALALALMAAVAVPARTATPTDGDVAIPITVADLTTAGGTELKAYQSVYFSIAFKKKPLPGLTGAERDQVLAAFRALYPNLTNVDTGFPVYYARHNATAMNIRVTFDKNQTDLGSPYSLLFKLTTPSELTSIVPAEWGPTTEHMSWPYLTNSYGTGYGIPSKAGRVPGLLLTLKLANATKADAQAKFDAIKAALRAATPGITAATKFLVSVYYNEESGTAIGGTLSGPPPQYRNAHAFIRLNGPARESLLGLAYRLTDANITSLFPLATFGKITAEPYSVRLAYIGNAVIPPPPPRPPPPAPTAQQWTPRIRLRAERLALYSAALRCKWPRVANWSCVDCRFGETKLLASWVSKTQFDEATDAFTIHRDSSILINGIVVTFRSTYGNIDGWLSNIRLPLVSRTIGGRTHRLHKGFSSSYYNQIRAALLPALKEAIGGNPNTHVYITGHSRGGAMSTLAAMDIVLDKAAFLGLADPKNQVRLYTLGQPRVGDAAYSQRLEKSIFQRFRIVSNADVAPHVPPTTFELGKSQWLLNGFLKGVINWLKKDYPDFLVDVISHLNDIEDIIKDMGADKYFHWGPYILSLDYQFSKTGRLKKDIQCAKSDDDPLCESEALGALIVMTKRQAEPPYNWIGSVGYAFNEYPTYALLDHGYYLGVDVGNEPCVAMKPPGWFGWKLQVGTVNTVGSGTDTDVFASWRCGDTVVSPPTSNSKGTLLDCTLSFGEVLDGDLDDINCFEYGDLDMFGWEFNRGRSKASTTDFLSTTHYANTLTKAQDPVAACGPAGVRPVISVKTKASVDDWDLGSLWLGMSFADGPDDRLTTKYFGDCGAPTTPLPYTYDSDHTYKDYTLCESKPPFRWRVTLKTADVSGAGTDANIKVFWRCGNLPATTGNVSMEPRPACDGPPTCFERNDRDQEDVVFNPGKRSSLVTAANYPEPACTQPSSQVALDVFFRGDGFADEWIMDVANSKLELWYVQIDQTFIWDEVVGNQLTKFEYMVFRPCDSKLTTQKFTTSTKFYKRSFTLCRASG